MLENSNGILKTDAVLRFAKGLKKFNDEAQELLREASKILKVQYKDMRPRILDHQIWRKISSFK